MRSRFVAAMTRTSTFKVSVPPTRSNSRCCSARRSFTCVESGISPISSRKSVPPSASSNRPSLRPTAPVKDPRSWPNSSDSRSVSLSAAQLTLMKAWSRLGDSSCSACAMSSLPVPDSPRMRTVALGRSRLLHQLENGLQFRRFADHPVQAEPLVDALSQRPRVALQTALLDGFGEKDEERLDRDRLGQVVLGARLHRLDRRLDLGERGHDDEDGVRPLLLSLPQEGEAVHLRHAQVGEHDTGRKIPEKLERLLAVLRLTDLVTLVGEKALERASRVLLVVDQQDPFRSHGRISTCEF